MKKSPRPFWVLISFFLLTQSLLGCAIGQGLNDSPERRGSAPAHPAAYSQDHFTFEKEKTPHPRSRFDFFYKQCSVEERRPFPVGAIWQCTSI